MFADFRKAFKPTKEEKKKSKLMLLKLETECVEKEYCSSCKYHVVKQYYEMGHSTSIGYCTKKKRYDPKHCDEWDVRY